MCMPPLHGMEVELTSEAVNSELAQWLVQVLNDLIEGSNMLSSMELGPEDVSLKCPLFRGYYVQA